MTIHNDSLPSLDAFCEKDSLLQSAKLLLADEFFAVDEHTLKEIYHLKLYLTEKEILVAVQQKDSKLCLIRTHFISEVEADFYPDNPSIMVIQTRAQSRFLYLMRRGASGLALWMSRINRIKCNCVTGSRSNESIDTSDERSGDEQPEHEPQASNTMENTMETVEALTMKKPSNGLISHEWHGVAVKDSSDTPDYVPTSKSSPFPYNNKFLQHCQLPNGEDFHSCLEQRRRSLSAPSADELLPAIRKSSDSLESSPPPDNNVTVSTPTSSRRRFRLPSSVTRFLSPSADATSKRHKKKDKRVGREDSVESGLQSPVQLKAKSPGKLLRSFKKRFSISAIASTDSLEDESPFSSHVHPLADSDETDGPSVTLLGKLYAQSAQKIAEELTLMDAELLRRIERKELENGAWMKKQSKHDTSPNVLQLISSFNKLALLVSTEIVQEKSVQSRGKAISNYIKVANHCYKLHNYNSLNAILAGLQSASVYRLRKSWKCVSARKMRKYEFLKQLMSPEGKWCNYMAELEEHQQNKTHCVPFFGQFLTALSQEHSLGDMHLSKINLPPAWAETPVPDSGSKIAAQCSGTSLSLPDITASLNGTADNESEPLHALRLLPLTSSQSANDVRNLSENSIADSHNPTITTITEFKPDLSCDNKDRTDSAAWESLQSSQNSVDKNKSQQITSLDDSLLADSAIGMDCKETPTNGVFKEPKEEPEPVEEIDTSAYELPTLETSFESKSETILNGSFISITDEGPSASSSVPSSISSDLGDQVTANAYAYEESSDDEDDEELCAIKSQPSSSTFSSIHSNTSGLLFGQPRRQTPPPPFPINLSVGNRPGCSGMQYILERDPTITFEEQVRRIHTELIRQVQIYWNKPANRHSTGNMDESITKQQEDYSQPGGPKGKGSSHYRPKAGVERIKKQLAEEKRLKEAQQQSSDSKAQVLTTPNQHGHSRAYSEGTGVVVSSSSVQVNRRVSVSTPENDTTQNFQLEATTPNLILLEKYKYFSFKYQKSLKEKPMLKSMIEQAPVLSEDSLYSLSCLNEPDIKG